MFSSSLKKERTSTSGMQQDKQDAPPSVGGGVFCKKSCRNYFEIRNNLTKLLFSGTHLVYDI